VIELTRQPANNRLVASIGPTQAAAAQAAKMLVGTNHHNRLSHALCLHSSNNA